MLTFLKTKLHNIHTSVTHHLKHLLSKEVLDETAFKELEQLLISADTGVATSRTIIERVQKNLPAHAPGSECKKLLSQQLTHLLTQHSYIPHPSVHLLVGINGSGKTTFAGKLAHTYTAQNKKVLLVAADTFRAAASAQLQEWAQRANATLVAGKPEQDPASLVFEACELFKQGTYDKLIIDTAGRLQTKTHLMKELEKVHRIIAKQLPTNQSQTLLVVDAMLGQNSLEQAKLFHEATPLGGIVLTKMDGTGKGGIVFAISQQLHIPIAYLSYGEDIEDLQIFNAHQYVQQLLGD